MNSNRSPRRKLEDRGRAVRRLARLAKLAKKLKVPLYVGKPTRP